MANANWYTDRPRGALVTSTVYNDDHRGHLENYDRAWASKGLVVMNNTANPGTQLDMYADFVAFHAPAGYNVTGSQVTATCNLTVAGPIVNGRDQAAAFPSTGWVHFYWIASRAGGIASIASLNGPAVGPTLPTGYTHWAYVTTVLTGGGALLWPIRQSEQQVLYVQDETLFAPLRVLTAGQSLTFATVDTSAVVPPVSRLAQVRWVFSVIDTLVGRDFHGFYRPTTGGFIGAQGTSILAAVIQTANIIFHTDVVYPVWLSASQTFQYRVSTVPNVAGGLYLTIMGYTVPA